jgi:hypothetical protein
MVRIRTKAFSPSVGRLSPLEKEKFGGSESTIGSDSESVREFFFVLLRGFSGIVA